MFLCIYELKWTSMKRCLRKFDKGRMYVIELYTINYVITHTKSKSTRHSWKQKYLQPMSNLYSQDIETTELICTANHLTGFVKEKRLLRG